MSDEIKNVESEVKSDAGALEHTAEQDAVKDAEAVVGGSNIKAEIPEVEEQADSVLHAAEKDAEQVEVQNASEFPLAVEGINEVVHTGAVVKVAKEVAEKLKTNLPEVWKVGADIDRELEKVYGDLRSGKVQPVQPKRVDHAPSGIENPPVQNQSVQAQVGEESPLVTQHQQDEPSMGNAEPEAKPAE